ncbi:glycoside hydrolase family 2 protein [Kribbella deserti]|uniref:beta-mannosidase n=1 Tax=Kribbella deserti TaxID=1926257 RepID=A0ABV6QR81_9ACTN
MTTSLSRVPLGSAAGSTWTVRATTGPVPPELERLFSEPSPATVPGEVHTDLLAAGLIDDPFDGANEHLLAWIGRTGWSYRTSFDWDPDGREVQELVTDGLDTAATITLNGTELGRTCNQHRAYRFDVTAVLVAGTNDLVIEFAAPVDTANRLSDEAEGGRRPGTNVHPYNAIRKMASNFGWDWGPDVATVGIWQPIALESWSGARLAAVRPLAHGDGLLETHVDLAWSPTAELEQTVAVTVGDTSAEATVAPGTESVVLRNTVPNVDRWWPRGYGDQPLYDVEVALGGSGSANWQGRVGFRTVELELAPDEHGSPFELSVNGRKIYIRGANWIPDDAFVTRLDRKTYERSIRDAIDAGMNMLRVWGGGIYESKDFYDICDELGVLVWQDFLFACAAYSEEEPLRGEVEAEARQAVTRLSRHASLAIWNGNNENIWGYVEWSWQVPLAGRTWGEGYYLDLLPKIVAELDPRTPYSAGSPFSYSNFIHPNDERFGTMHIWDVWNQVDYSAYRNYRPRFVSEFGFQGPPAWSTLTSVVHDEPLDPYGEQMLVHQKAHEGNLKLERGLGDHLPRWSNIDDWHWSTQLNQARAVAYGIEHFRGLFPLNTGSMVWQLNDNWPVISWAAVDGHGIRKPLWYALRRVYADRLITVQPGPVGPVIALHNDSDELWSTRLTMRRRSTGTDVLATEEVDITVGARGATSVVLPSSVATSLDEAGEYVEVLTTDGHSAYWYFAEDTTLRLLPPDQAFTANVKATDSGYEVTVEAHALVKDLALFPDRLDPAARVDSSLITLSAGDSHTFRVSNAVAPNGPLDVPVLRSVNDLVN